MESKEIIKKYLPMLQDLQTKVAAHKHFSMTISVDGEWGIVATLTVPTNDKDKPIDVVHEHWHLGYSEEELDQKVISINAAYAQAIVTTVTGINYPIYNN